MNELQMDKNTFDNLLDRKSVFFIQIGANDGKEFDPIHKLIVKNNWKGILFEPGEEAYTKLTETYKDFTDLVLVNSAVSYYDGKVNLFCGSTPPHFTLNEVMANHIFDVTPTVVEVDVVSPTTIIDKYKVKQIDLLQIDTEGHDFIIIKAFPFHIIKPSIIRFEYTHLHYEGTHNVEECIDFLNKHGYVSYFDRADGDIISILN